MRAFGREAEQHVALLFDVDNVKAAEEEEDNKEPDTDNELGPVFQAWADRLSSSDDFIKLLTNFTAVEFQSIWNQVSNIVQTSWNVGDGRRSVSCERLRDGRTIDRDVQSRGVRRHLSKGQLELVGNTGAVHRRGTCRDVRC